MLLCAALNGHFVHIFAHFCLWFSPFPLAERSASSRDQAAVVLVLFGVVLQESVLVPVQVVHQIAIATVLGHQIQRACLVKEEFAI